MINKKAFLIGCSGGYRDLKFLKGVSIDIDNYLIYLRSHAGGHWDENEIIILKDIDSKTLINIINKVKLDYSFIAFCGHGQINTFTEIDFVCLRDKNLSLKYLISKSDRQTIIIDVCRQIESNLPISDKNFFVQESSLQIKDRVIQQVFNESISKTPKGIILVYSTEPFGISGEDHNLGGHFTYSLIKAGFNWWNGKNNQGILKLNSAVDDAGIILKSTFKTSQKPLMGGQIRRLTFPPFACSQNENNN